MTEHAFFNHPEIQKIQAQIENAKKARVPVSVLDLVGIRAQWLATISSVTRQLDLAVAPMALPTYEID